MTGTEVPLQPARERAAAPGSTVRVGATSSAPAGEHLDQRFDVHSGPYTVEFLDTRSLEELREIRRLIRGEQRKLVDSFKDSVTASDPFYTDEEFHRAGLDYRDEFYIPVITDEGTRHYKVSSQSHPELHAWRDRARLVQEASAYSEWIETRRRETLERLRQNPIITNCEIVTSPANDKWVVFATVQGVRRRVAQQDDQTGY